MAIEASSQLKQLTTESQCTQALTMNLWMLHLGLTFLATELRIHQQQFPAIYNMKALPISRLVLGSHLWLA